MALRKRFVLLGALVPLWQKIRGSIHIHLKIVCHKGSKTQSSTKKTL